MNPLSEQDWSELVIACAYTIVLSWDQAKPHRQRSKQALCEPASVITPLCEKRAQLQKQLNQFLSKLKQECAPTPQAQSCLDACTTAVRIETPLVDPPSGAGKQGCWACCCWTRLAGADVVNGISLIDVEGGETSFALTDAALKSIVMPSIYVFNVLGLLNQKIGVYLGQNHITKIDVASCLPNLLSIAAPDNYRQLFNQSLLQIQTVFGNTQSNQNQNQN